MDGIGFTYKLVPLRMMRGKDISVDIIVQLENKSDKDKLVSLEAAVSTPGMLGFDATLTHKRAVNKIGVLPPLTSKEASFRVYGSMQTKPGDYEIELLFTEHFQDFTKVMHEFRRKATIRVI